MSATASASVRTISIASSTVAPSSTAAYSDFINPPAVSGGYFSSCWIRAATDPGNPSSTACARSVGHGFQEVGRVVGIQFLDDAAQLVGGQRVENLAADGRREPGHDGRGRRHVEEGEHLAPGLGPADQVQHLRDVRRVERRNHRLDGFRVRRLQLRDESLEPLLVCHGRPVFARS